MNEFLRRFLGLKKDPHLRSQPVGWSTTSWFLTELESIGDEHDEIYDTEVKENLWSYLESRFIKYERDTPLPSSFGMFSPEGDEKIRQVFLNNTERLETIISVFELDTVEKRKVSFTNTKLRTERGSKLEDFFGSP